MTVLPKKTTLKQNLMGGALTGVLMTALGVAAPMVALTQTASSAPADN